MFEFVGLQKYIPSLIRHLSSSFGLKKRVVIFEVNLTCNVIDVLFMSDELDVSVVRRIVQCPLVHFHVLP